MPLQSLPTLLHLEFSMSIGDLSRSALYRRREKAPARPKFPGALVAWPASQSPTTTDLFELPRANPNCSVIAIPARPSVLAITCDLRLANRVLNRQTALLVGSHVFVREPPVS